MNSTQHEITVICDEIKTMLLDKNMKYGDSAINPTRFLSKASNEEQILVRIDDKLNRLAQGSSCCDDEDVISDLIGYLILLKIARKKRDYTPLRQALDNLKLDSTFIPFDEYVSEYDWGSYGYKDPLGTLRFKDENIDTITLG